MTKIWVVLVAQEVSDLAGENSDESDQGWGAHGVQKKEARFVRTQTPAFRSSAVPDAIPLWVDCGEPGDDAPFACGHACHGMTVERIPCADDKKESTR